MAPAGAVAIISIAPSGVEVLGARNVIVEIRRCPSLKLSFGSLNIKRWKMNPLTFGVKDLFSGGYVIVFREL